ncbi:MAG: 5'/3'-nucleotidase SurE, partial [Patescibacteria group bacterium]
MTKIKRILLTGDDGYNSIGTRLLIQALKSDFELSVIATREQQSGVGGKVSVVGGGKWGQAQVDGVPAIWLDGTPCDCMECAKEFYPQPFDLIISGINLGVNIGGSIISSGTFSAAYRGVCLGVAPRAIAISWDVQYHLLYRNHSGKESIRKFYNYPGKTVAKLLRQAMMHNFWDSPLLNINLPAQPTSRARFTKLLLDIYGY